MEFFSVEISESAEQLDYSALSQEEYNALFQGVTHNPASHDIYRILMAASRRPANRNWNKRLKKRKRFDIVDKVLVNMRPESQSIRIAGIFPISIANEDSGGGELQMTFETSISIRVIGVANANSKLRLSGPIKKWWERRRPLVHADRTDRVANWVYSREWLDAGSQVKGELLCEVPKSLSDTKRHIKCSVEYQDKGERAVESSHRGVKLPSHRVP